MKDRDWLVLAIYEQKDKLSGDDRIYYFVTIYVVMMIFVWMLMLRDKTPSLTRW